MENIYNEGDQVILLHVVEQPHLPFLAGMKTIIVAVGDAETVVSSDTYLQKLTEVLPRMPDHRFMQLGGASFLTTQAMHRWH